MRRARTLAAGASRIGRISIGPPLPISLRDGHEAVMDRNQMVKERARLQAALDAYHLAAVPPGAEEESEPGPERHPRLAERIAQLDRRIAEARDG